MTLLDTNIFIEFYRGNPTIATEMAKITKPNFAASDITVAELYFGAKNKQELNFIRKDLSSINILPVQAGISSIAISLMETYCLSHRLALADAYIAATAIYHNIELYTLNLKDFYFLPDIKIYGV